MKTEQPIFSQLESEISHIGISSDNNKLDNKTWTLLFEKKIQKKTEEDYSNNDSCRVHCKG